MALVIVLCALFLLSMVIFGLAQRVNQGMFLTGRDNRSLEARALAFSGTQIALHPQVTSKTPLLRRQVDANHRYEARITGEGGKLNLNWLLAGEDANRLAVLSQYLEVRGLTFQDRQTLVDCLLDFVSPNSAPPPQRHQDRGRRPARAGPPVQGSVGSAPRGAQRAADEPAKLGPGFYPAQPGAGGPAMGGRISDRRAAGGGALAGAERSSRSAPGRTGSTGTADDIQFAGIGDAEALLNLNVAQNPAIQSLVSLNDTTVRVISVGQAFNVRRKTIEVVARKVNMQPQILQWKEY